MRPRITIITPNFNHCVWLERAMLSVLDQGYPNLEYVVLDGGSTDGSVNLIKRYADRLSRWSSGPDGGQVEAINNGIDESTGQIISYLNSDDYYLPGALERAAAAFEASDKLWAVGASVFTGARSAEVGYTTSRWIPSLPAGPRSHWLLYQWSFPQPSSFWRRELFERAGQFDAGFRYCFDTEHALRCLLEGFEPEIIEDDLAARFLHLDTKSAGDSADWQRERKLMQQKLRPLLTPVERVRYALELALERSGIYRFVNRSEAPAPSGP